MAAIGPDETFETVEAAVVTSLDTSENTSELGILDTPPKYPSNRAFIDGAQADVILRSSDGVDFKVIKSILALSSPFFRDMFSLPQSPDTQRDDSTGARQQLPIVQLEETSAVIDAILCILYPFRYPLLTVEDSDIICGVAEASQKFDIEFVREFIRRSLSEGLDSESCVSVYAIACKFKFEDEIELAAREFAKRPIRHNYIPELRLISCPEYFQLIDYHRRLTDALVDTVSSEDFAKHTDNIFNFRCNVQTCNPQTKKITGEIAQLLNDTPIRKDLFTNATLIRCNLCHNCRFKLYDKWSSFDSYASYMLASVAETVNFDRA